MKLVHFFCGWRNNDDIYIYIYFFFFNQKLTPSLFIMQTQTTVPRRLNANGNDRKIAKLKRCPVGPKRAGSAR